MAFFNTDEIGDIDSLTSEQREENSRNLNAIESLDDIYKTYRPMQRSSSTSTLKGSGNVNIVESIECNNLQEATAKTNITNPENVNIKCKGGQQKEDSEIEKNYKAQLSKKAAPPPPSRSSRSPLRFATATPEEVEEIQFNAKEKDYQTRIASGEITKIQAHGSEYQQDNVTESPYKPRNTVKFINGENGQPEMIASDYYAQQIAMQMSNPIYSYGGYGQPQLMAGPQNYQFQSPESDYLSYMQLQGQLQSMGNYGQYPAQGMQGIQGMMNYAQSTDFGQYNQYQYMSGGGGGQEISAEERCGRRTDSGEDEYDTCCEKNEESSCSTERSCSLEDGCPCGTNSNITEETPTCCPRRAKDANCTYNCCSANPHACYSCPDSGCFCSDEERGFEMPESMATTPQCRVGSGRCPTKQSRFSFVDRTPNMCAMNMPGYGGVPTECGMPYCMMSAPNCGSMPPQCCQMPCYSAPAPAPAPPQCCPMSCYSPPAPAPAPAAAPMNCCSPTPAYCACSGNCLNIEGFLQQIRAAQQQQQQCGCSTATSSSCYPQEPPCCGNDRLQSQTVYTTDYQPFCGRGNNFNHFPKCNTCGSCGSCGGCTNCMANSSCMPSSCCYPTCRSDPCCNYELPPSGCSATCSSPFPATCNTACCAPCYVPYLSSCNTAPYDSYDSNCPPSCEMPPCNVATSCNLNQCGSFS